MPLPKPEEGGFKHPSEANLWVIEHKLSFALERQGIFSSDDLQQITNASIPASMQYNKFIAQLRTCAEFPALEHILVNELCLVLRNTYETGNVHNSMGS